MSSVSDLPAFPPPGFTKEKAEELLKVIEKAKRKAAEEPVKPYWFVNDLDGKPMKCDLKNCGKSNFVRWSENRKQIGNYFGTEEEAEKAVEKLKAWKRLKDTYHIRFVLDFVKNTISFTYRIDDTLRSVVDEERIIFEDMKTIFGGEE